MRLLSACSVLIAACATTGARAQQDGGWFRAPSDAASAPAVAGASGDAGAEADFRSALSKLSQGDRDGARAALDSFIDRHPAHPYRLTAVAIVGRLALERGDAAGAKAVIEARAPGASDPGLSFVAGVAESRLGRPEQALVLLRPFAISGPPSMGGTADDDAELMLRSALGDALAATRDPAGALGQWEAYLRHEATRPHERAYARARAEEVAGKLNADAALEACRSSESALVKAVLGAKAADGLRARGDTDGARRMDDDAASLRRRLGFDAEAAWVGPGDPTRLGLAVPMSGRAYVVGEVVLRGAMLAIGEPTAAESPPFQLLVRDIAAGERGGEAPIAGLTRQDAVIGVVATPDARALDQTTRDGVPLLLLDEQAPGPHTTAFQMIHSPEARAAALARHAASLGARTFAVLAPDSQAGQRLAEAFKRGVAAARGRLVAQVSYVAGTTSFGPSVAQIKRANPDAVFVPDDSERLELVAPALAVADLMPAPRPSRAAGSGGRREILLLSTARGLSARLIKNAGRYVQGALLAPGFFAADDDPRTTGFVSKFRALYNQDPTASDAYGYDGVQVLRAAVERGARTRADVLRLLAAQTFQGVTGDVRFGPDHARVDLPTVYVVSGDAITTLR